VHGNKRTKESGRRNTGSGDIVSPTAAELLSNKNIHTHAAAADAAAEISLPVCVCASPARAVMESLETSVVLDQNQSHAYTRCSRTGKITRAEQTHFLRTADQRYFIQRTKTFWVDAEITTEKKEDH
jgi:hypothetical protein